MYFEYYEECLNEWCLTKLPFFEGVYIRIAKFINPKKWEWINYVPKSKIIFESEEECLQRFQKEKDEKQKEFEEIFKL